MKITDDLDFLAARLHGRREKMAEGARLDALCRLASVPDLARALYPGTAPSTSEELQRRLIEDLAGELFGLAGSLTGPQAGLIEWLLKRFEAENIKLQIRGLGSVAERDPKKPALIVLPGAPSRDAGAARTPEELTLLLPKGLFRESLKEAVAAYPANSRPFFYEAALDRAYLQELLDRAGKLSGPDRGAISALVRQEADIFNLALLARGKFVYGLRTEILAALRVEGTGISRRRFAAMLEAPDLAGALELLPAELKPAQSSGPALDPAALEVLGWRRFSRLADRAFRNSHIGFGVVAGYAALRRLETANLITLCEGLRLGMPGADIRSRLIGEGGGAHV